MNLKYSKNIRSFAKSARSYKEDFRYKASITKRIVLNLFSKKYSQIKGERILMVYDLSTQPFSIGDILMYHEASLILKQNYGIITVDFAMVFDPLKPSCPDPSFSSINQDNIIFNLNSIIPVALFNEFLGSFFVFNSHSKLIKYISDNESEYIVWPSVNRILSEKYNYFEIFNSLIAGCLDEYKKIPRISATQYLRSWAYSFLKANSLNCVPVTINIRNNPNHGTHRNADIEAWLRFFEMCYGIFPVKFLLICSKSEVDKRFNDCPNLVIVKNYYTRIDQDLALISVSAFHMGSDTGPAALAYFSDRPFLIVNTDMIVNKVKYADKDDQFVRVKHLYPSQHVSCFKENPEFLYSEFERMWSLTLVDEWISGKVYSDISAKGDLNWLR